MQEINGCIVVASTEIVIARTAIETVGTAASIKRIVVGTPEQCVVAVTTVKVVHAVATIEEVIALLAVQPAIAVAQALVADATPPTVVTVSPVQAVVARATDQQITVSCALQAVIAEVAKQLDAQTGRGECVTAEAAVDQLVVLATSQVVVAIAADITAIMVEQAGINQLVEACARDTAEIEVGRKVLASEGGQLAGRVLQGGKGGVAAAVTGATAVNLQQNVIA